MQQILMHLHRMHFQVTRKIKLLVRYLKPSDEGFIFIQLFQWYLHLHLMVELEFVQVSAHAFLECEK